MNRHLTQEEIEQYIDSEYLYTQNEMELSVAGETVHLSAMTTENILQIEEHLVKCDTCLEKVTKALDFSISYYQWLEESPTADQKLFLQILQASQYQESDVRKRLMKWMKDWRAFLSDTVDVLIDTTYKGLSNITKLITKDEKNKTKKWTFNYPVETFAMRGHPDLKYEKRVENRLYGLIGEKKILDIKAQSETKKITINCKKFDNADTSPIFVLFPLDGREPIIKLSRYPDENQDYEISIEGLNPGQYILAIEPDQIL